MAGPVSGSAYTFTLSLFSQSTGNVIQNPTIAAGDFNISTDGGSLTPLATTPTVTPANSYIVEFNLTSGEVGTDHFTIVCIDAAGSEWKDVVFHETVQAKNDTVDVDAIADGVWDESQSGHTTPGTFGYYLDDQVSSIVSDFGTVVLSAEIVTQDFEGSIIETDLDAALITQDVEDAEIVSQDITGTTITQDFEGNISQ
jgi:hypothetical protein